MLEIGSKTITVEGVTVFADHADPNQFWYLPTPVGLARRLEDNRAAFTFIKYGNVVDDKVEGKGFLTFEVNLHLNPHIKRSILARLSSIAEGKPKLAAVPFDEGTVECIALDLQGGGGTTAQLSNEGTFQAVESILGATVPSLHGDNSAAFSLSLSQEGATILDGVFKGGGSPIGVVYNLKYTALRPALEVEITANFKRVYDHFSANLEGQVYFVKAGIEAGFEKLVQDGIIKIKVINYSTADDRMEQEKWALDFFKEKLLNEWFKPTLTPGQLAGGLAVAENLTAVQKRVESFRPRPSPPPPRPQAQAAATTTTSSENSGNTSNTNNTARPIQVVRRGVPEEVAQIENPPVSSGNQATQAIQSATNNMPPVSGAPSAVQDAGLGFRPQNLPNTANSVVDNALVSFKLKYIKQIEDKSLTLKLNRSEAVQRTYAPQGFFGLLVKDLAKEGHFFEIDGDDAFFREFSVSIESPFDKEAIGLASTHIKLKYGTPDTDEEKHGDFIIDKDNEDQLNWLVKTIPGHTHYAYQIQHHFKPDSGWHGEQSSYEFPEKITQDRTLLIHPFDKIGFLNIEVSTTPIDWELVADAEVELLYSAPSGWIKRETMFFTKQVNAPQNWKLRISDPEARSYTYRIKYHLKDGTTQLIDWQQTEASKVIIPNPFHMLDVEFIPFYLPGEVRMVFIDLEYEDTDNNHKVVKRLRLNGNSMESAIAKLPIIDFAKQQFRYRLTFVGNTGLKRGAFITTKETLIGVQLPTS